MLFADAILFYEHTSGELVGINYYDEMRNRRRQHLHTVYDEMASIACALPLNICKRLLRLLRCIENNSSNASRLSLLVEIQELHKKVTDYIAPEIVEKYKWRAEFYYGIFAARDFDAINIHVSFFEIFNRAGIFLTQQQHDLANACGGVIAGFLRSNIFDRETLFKIETYNAVTSMVDAAILEINGNDEDSFLIIQEAWRSQPPKPLIVTNQPQNFTFN